MNVKIEITKITKYECPKITKYKIYTYKPNIKYKIKIAKMRLKNKTFFFLRKDHLKCVGQYVTHL